MTRWRGTWRRTRLRSYIFSDFERDTLRQFFQDQPLSDEQKVRIRQLRHYGKKHMTTLVKDMALLSVLLAHGDMIEEWTELLEKMET